MHHKIFFPQGPNFKKQVHRGVGRYYAYLKEALEKYDLVTVVDQPLLADLVHYTYFDLFFASLPFFSGRKKNQKTVVTIHDVIPLVLSSHYPVGRRGKLAFTRQKLALRKVNMIITDSQASKKDISHYLKVKPEKITVVPLAANPHLRRASDLEVYEMRRRFNLSQPYILYVGDINYNKNIPQLIKTLKYLPDEIQLVCVGKNFIPQPIPEWRSIEEQIALSDVKERIHFLTDILGVDADQTLSELYSGALVYIQPSLYEGFGLPVLEALQCGAPVICARNSSLPEVGGTAVTYSSQADAFNFAEAVKKIIAQSPTERAALIEAGLAHAAQFSWKKTAVATNLVYQKLISQSSKIK